MKLISNETSSLVVISGLNVALKLAGVVTSPGAASRLLALAKKVGVAIKMRMLVV